MKHEHEVRAKKFLGQHFLTDEKTAVAIVDALPQSENKMVTLEIGPGMGVLTKYLLQRNDIETWAIELDRESVPYLREHYPAIEERLLEGDFLRLNLQTLFPQPFMLIGNFPYNISTQILFAILENKEKIPVMVGMFQKEVAERIASGPGNKDYGILSVLLQPWFEIEYLFTVEPELFNPPPRVKSAVIRMVRNNRMELGVDEAFFKTVIKTAFNQRRKTLRNALRPLLPSDFSHIPFLDLRAERLSWEQFVTLTKLLYLSK
jgi:16S rRNA (adenine1518-N6/adenine1519-N6)-dimethyltransferase